MEENYRIREPAAIVGQTVPRCHAGYIPGGGLDTHCYRFNCEKIARLLPSFRPQWTARKGAKQLYAACREAGLRFTDI